MTSDGGSGSGSGGSGFGGGVFGGGAGGGGGLTSSAADKKRAATYMEQHQLPNTRSAGAMDEGGAGAAVGSTSFPPSSGPPVYGPFPLTPAQPAGTPDTGLTGLTHWATDAGLATAMGTWRGQVARLMTRLEGELGALRATNTLFTGNDLLTGAQIRSVPPGLPLPPGSPLQPGLPDLTSRVGDL